MTSLATTRPVPWRVDATPVALISLGHAVSHFYQLAFAPMFPWWRDAFALDWTRLGLIMSTFYVVSCLGQAAAGFVVDRIGSRRSLIGGFLLMAAGTALAAGAGGYAMLIAAAATAALGNSVLHPADFALLNHKISERRMGHAYSVHAVCGTLGYASAPILLTAIALAAGWRMAMIVATSLGLAMALVVWLRAGDFTVPPEPEDRGGDSRPVEAPAEGAPATTGGSTIDAAGGMAFFNAALAACMLFFITVNIASIGIQNMGASLLEGLGRMEKAEAARWITAYLATIAVGTLIGGFLVSALAASNRSGAGGQPRLPGYERIASSAMLVGALALFLLIQPVTTPLASGLLLCVVGLVLGVAMPARDMLVRAAAPRRATGRAYGIVYSAVDIGAAIGPALLGWMLDQGRPALSFATAGVALIVTAGIGWLIAHQVRRLGLGPAAR